jgi:hypothetical protein
MNKRGDIPALDWLVENIPKIIMFVGALAILIGMILAIVMTPPTTGEDNFKRIKTDFDSFIKKEYKGPTSADVPLTAQYNYRIILYNQNEAPTVCQKQPCLCLYDYNEGKQKFIETCAPYEKLRGECTGNCKTPCVTKTSQVDVIVGQKFTIKLSRTCGEFTIS